MDRLAGRGDRVNFLPPALRDWDRTTDRDMDAPVVPDNRIPDTRLFRVRLPSGEWRAVRLLGRDAIVEVLREGEVPAGDREKFLSEVLNRIEYISSTLSVRNIREILSALAVRGPVDSPALASAIHGLGEEILVRFSSLTLYSVASISSSLAALGTDHPGLLNILAVAFRQSLVDRAGDYSDFEIIDHVTVTLEAYHSLDRLLPMVLDSGVEALERVGEIPADYRIRLERILPDLGATSGCYTTEFRDRGIRN
jgi:hypothetical protein